MYKCMCVLLLIALEAFKIEGCHQGTVAESGDSSERDLFSQGNIEHTLDIMLPSLFKAVQDQSIGCAPLVLSSCLLAFLWLLDEEGKQCFVLFFVFILFNMTLYPPQRLLSCCFNHRGFLVEKRQCTGNVPMHPPKPNSIQTFPSPRTLPNQFPIGSF